MLRNKKLVVFLAVMVIAAFTLAGCTAPGDQPAEKETVKLLYVEWSCATATTHVLADVLEKKMGYEVELLPVTAAAMYQGLANGDGDAIFCSWLPVTHGSYMDNLGDKLENLGPNMQGAKIGLVVPEYVTINSIEEMNSAKDKFDGQIIGIDPGAGIMRCTDQALEDYDLDFEVVEGSGATMTASLKKAVDDNEWVAVTGWTPHWKFARWDLKYLEDPKKVYGEEEHIDTVVRQGLNEDMPDVYALFDNFAWTSDDLSAAMVMAEDLGDSEQAAAKWVEENAELVNEWLPK